MQDQEGGWYFDVAPSSMKKPDWVQCEEAGKAIMDELKRGAKEHKIETPIFLMLLNCQRSKKATEWIHSVASNHFGVPVSGWELRMGFRDTTHCTGEHKQKRA